MEERTVATPLSRLTRVLLIEDSEEDAILFQRALRAVCPECTVTVRERLADGLEALRTDNFDLVVLDLGLPDSHGMDALRRIRSVVRVPTVVLTGNDDQRVATAALQAGAQDYIVKGQYEPRMLLRAAHHAIDRAETVELREAERLKSELLATVSHEMRTPLTVIQENISLVLEGALGPVAPEQKEFLTSAVANCGRLRAMIADLVDTAAIERGALQLTRMPVALMPLLRSLATDFVTVFSTRAQQFSVELPADDTVMVFGDADRLRQAVGNLLTNAHKFTDRGGHIVLRASCDHDHARIDVEDNGAGIPANALDHVFERFVQLGREHGPGLKGAGLGLPIVRHIVERHDGTIDVRSDVGQGATFRITLPRLHGRGELRALLGPFAAAKNLGKDLMSWAGFVRVRAGARSVPPDMLVSLAERLRGQLRNGLDEVLFLEVEQMVVIASTAGRDEPPWLADRLLQIAAGDAAVLEWTVCAVADALAVQSPAELGFTALGR